MKFGITFRHIKTFFPLIVMLYSAQVTAQSVAEGVVISKETGTPMADVAVTSDVYKTGMFTNAKGHYSIKLANSDTLRFSYLGNKEQKILIHGGWRTHYTFNISMEIEPLTVVPLTVNANRELKNDSIKNRESNSYIFNYKNPKVHTSLLGANIESAHERYIDPHYQRLKHYKVKMLKAEKFKYVWNYFNPVTIQKISGLRGERLNFFVKNYLPHYTSFAGKTEYEIDEYILDLTKKFSASKPYSKLRN